MRDRSIVFTIMYGLVLLVILLGLAVGYYIISGSARSLLSGSGDKTDDKGRDNGIVKVLPGTKATGIPPQYDAEITISNDWTGNKEHGNGIKRIPYIAMSDIELSSSMPPAVDYSVSAFEIADMTAETVEMANTLSIPQMTPVTFIQIEIFFENVYGKEFYFYPSRSVLTINGNSLYPCSEDLCKGMGNLYRQRARKEGELYYFIEGIDKKDIDEVSLFIPAPTTKKDGEGEKLGSDVNILFHIDQVRTNLIKR